VLLHVKDKEREEHVNMKEKNKREVKHKKEPRNTHEGN